MRVGQTLRSVSAAALLTLAGCTSIMQGMLFGISERSVSRQVKVAVPETNKALMGLSAARGSSALKLSVEIPAGFRQAAVAGLQPAAAGNMQARIDGALAVLADATAKGLVKTSNDVLARAGAGPGFAAAGPPIALPTDRAGWTNLQRKLEDAALMGSWSALADASSTYAGSLAAGSAELAAAKRLERTAYYIGKYIRAYFSGMQLFRVQVDLSEFKTRLEESIKKRLKKLDPEMSDEELLEKTKELLAKELKSALRKLLKKDDLPKLDEILDKLLETGTVDNVWGYTLGSDGDEAVGFTSRAGDNFKWPTVEISINPSADDIVSWSDIDAKAIGSQLIRVFIEALFDAQLGVPAVASATAVSFPDKFKLEEFKPPEEGQAGVTAEEFNAINDWGGRAEGIASSAIGQLIRGIGWISLNNEALAGLIETSVGVMVRKLVEAALWERFHDDASESGESALAPGRIGHVTVDFRFTDLSRPADK